MDATNNTRATNWIEDVQLRKSGKPLVRTNRGIIEFFNKQKIVDSLLKETALANEYYPDLVRMSKEEAQELADLVYRKYIKRLPFVSGPLIRELICAEMLMKATKDPKYAIYRNFYTRVGMPIYDYIKIMEGRGFEARENANSQPNPETLHKKVADKAAKEANLLVAVPSYLADAHMKKRVHIHDLEYFNTRPFCVAADELIAFTNSDVVHISPIDNLIDRCSLESVKDKWEIFVPEERICITTPEGFKPISNVYRRSFSGNLIRLRCRGGYTIKVTPDHPIPVIGKGLIAAGKVEIGDRVSITKEVNPQSEMTDLDLFRLIRKDDRKWYVKEANKYIEKVSSWYKIAQELNLPLGTVYGWKYRKTAPLWAIRRLGIQLSMNTDFSYYKSRRTLQRIIPLTREFGEVVGLFVSEGHFVKEKGVAITNSNLSILNRFSRYIERIHLSPHRTVCAPPTPQSMTLSKSLYQLFCDILGIDRKAANRQIPDILLSANKEFIIGLLSGLFSGDGSLQKLAVRRKDVCTTYFLAYHTSSSVLAHQMIFLFRRFGVSLGIYTYSAGSRKTKMFLVGTRKRDYLKQLRDKGFRFLSGDRRNEYLEVDDFERIGNDPYEEEERKIVRKELVSYDGFVYDLTVDSDTHVFSNAEGIVVHNCQNHDLRYFMYSGLLPDGVGARTSVAGPAKHPEVAILHSVKALASAQTNWAGGQGWYNYTLFFAPYIRGLPYERVRQLAQMLFFEHTQAYVARGGQLLFASIEMPPGVPKIFRDIHVVKAGKVLEDVYGDYEDETRTMFKALCDVAMEGDRWGKPFFFPKMEIVYDKEFMGPGYEDCYLAAAKLASKFGIPYFENKIPGYRSGGDNGVRLGCYQCCSYDQASSPEEDPDFWDKLNFTDGKHFSWGAVQVVSLNMPQHAYIAKGNDTLLWEEIEKSMRMSLDTFKIKKKLMDKQMRNGLLPFMTMQPKVNGMVMPPLVDVSTLRYIVGLVGVNELVQYHVGEQLHESKEALRFALRTIVEMERIRKQLEDESGLLLAIARTPAESCAQSMAIADLIHYPMESRTVVKGDLNNWDEKSSTDGADAPVYYSNGTHTYVGARIPLSEKLTIEQPFWALMSGGNMFHVWLAESNPDPEAIMRLTRKIANETQIGYFAYTKDLTVCENCNITSPGLRDSCPNCNSENVEWYSRITGYYQSVGKNGSVAGWNAAKRQELLDRHKIGGEALFG